MKNLVKFCLLVTGIALVLYVAYLAYVKFIKEKDSEEDADLYEDETISFSERVKKAAEKQLEKIG